MKLYFNRYSCISQNTAIIIADCYYSNTDQAAQMYEKFADHTAGFTGINEWLSELTSVWEAVWKHIYSQHEHASDYWIEATERMLNDVCSWKLKEHIEPHDLLGRDHSPLKTEFMPTCSIMLQAYNEVTAYGEIQVDSALIKISYSCEKPVKQEDMLKFIQEQLNINVVTCGHCGSVFIHHSADKETTCPHCNSVNDPSDNPDLFYPGWDEFIKAETKEVYSGEITDENGLKVELSLKQTEDNVWGVDLRIEEGEREGEYIEGHAFNSYENAQIFYHERLSRLVKFSKETEPVIIDC